MDGLDLFYDLVGNSDSEDEEFLGFEMVDFSENDNDSDLVELNDTDLEEILNEIDREDRDPRFEAYDCKWLQEFVEFTGPRNIGDGISEYDIFSKIIDDVIISLFVEETNRYYKQYIYKIGGVEYLKKFARSRKWTDVSHAEMKVFIGMLLYIGLVRLPDYDCYWSKDSMIFLKGFTSLMPRDRFLNILTFFHVANNENELPRDHPNYDPTYKISNLAKLLIARWQNYYIPSRELSVDETLIPFKGRTKFLQCMPSKPHKWGLKVWTLAESSTGYVYNWQLYTGAKVVGADTGKGVLHRVVVNLCTPILESGYHVYCDNYFTSPALFQDLASKQTGACGTLRVNRTGVPKEIKKAKLKKGDSPVVYRDDKLLYISWNDRRQVNLLTTIHNGSCFTKTVRSRFSSDHCREVDYPRAIQLYSMYMGGVDSSDQQTQYCVSQHRFLKWWKKLVICNVFEVSFCNARTIWKKLHPGKNISSKNFRLSVIHGLIDGYASQRKPFSRPVSNPPLRLTGRHFQVINPNMTPGGRRSNPDCEVCSNREQKKRHQTQYICLDCDIPLCVYPCFARYHTLLDYKIVCNPTLHK